MMFLDSETEKLLQKILTNAETFPKILSEKN